MTSAMDGPAGPFSAAAIPGRDGGSVEVDRARYCGSNDVDQSSWRVGDLHV